MDGERVVMNIAKYKNHWEELSREGWHGLDKELQERHRSDLLQVLAYSTISASKRVVCCLAYPLPLSDLVFTSKLGEKNTSPPLASPPCLLHTLRDTIMV
jgi:hypothetical protein